MGRLSRLLGVLPVLCYAPCLPMTNNAGVYTVVTRIVAVHNRYNRSALRFRSACSTACNHTATTSFQTSPKLTVLLGHQICWTSSKRNRGA